MELVAWQLSYVLDNNPESTYSGMVRGVLPKVENFLVAEFERAMRDIPGAPAKPDRRILANWRACLLAAGENQIAHHTSPEMALLPWPPAEKPAVSREAVAIATNKANQALMRDFQPVWEVYLANGSVAKGELQDGVKSALHVFAWELFERTIREWSALNLGHREFVEAVESVKASVFKQTEERLRHIINENGLDAELSMKDARATVNSLALGRLMESENYESLATLRAKQIPVSDTSHEKSDVAAPGGTGSGEGRRRSIDAYISDVFRDTGVRITRTAIWKAAGYKHRREFEGWQRGEAKSGSAVDIAIRRVLSEKWSAKR